MTMQASSERREHSGAGDGEAGGGRWKYCWQQVSGLRDSGPLWTLPWSQPPQSCPVWPGTKACEPGGGSVEAARVGLGPGGVVFALAKVLLRACKPVQCGARSSDQTRQRPRGGAGTWRRDANIWSSL